MPLCAGYRGKAIRQKLTLKSLALPPRMSDFSAIVLGEPCMKMAI